MMVFDKERVSKDMPQLIVDAKIALVDFPLELKNPEIETKISISTPEQLQKFLSREEETIKFIISKVKNSGANVIFCQKGIDDFAQYLLSKENIYACRRVSKSDMEKLSRATGARIVSNLSELSNEQLGEAKKVEEIFNSDNRMTFVEGCKNPKAVTILIRGGTSHVIDEVERAIKDGLGDVSAVLKSGLIVAGGGAVEVEISRKLKDFAQSLEGREQLAVIEFANALEFIPSTLAENAGLDPIDVMTELKSRHNSGQATMGLNLFTNKIEDTLKAKIIEPYKIKTQAINSASEVATMILRIDDVIAANGKSNRQNKFNPMGDFD